MLHQGLVSASFKVTTKAHVEAPVELDAFRFSGRSISEVIATSTILGLPKLWSLTATIPHQSYRSIIIRAAAFAEHLSPRLGMIPVEEVSWCMN